MSNAIYEGQDKFSRQQREKLINLLKSELFDERYTIEYIENVDAKTTNYIDKYDKIDYTIKIIDRITGVIRIIEVQDRHRTADALKYTDFTFRLERIKNRNKLEWANIKAEWLIYTWSDWDENIVRIVIVSIKYLKLLFDKGLIVINNDSKITTNEIIDGVLNANVKLNKNTDGEDSSFVCFDIIMLKKFLSEDDFKKLIVHYDEW